MNLGSALEQARRSLQGSRFNVFAQARALPSFFSGPKAPKAPPLPRKGYKYIKGTSIQAPTGSTLHPESKQTVSPKSKPQRGVSMKIPSEISGPTIEEITKAIEMGSKGSPIATMSAQIAKQQSKYPIFEKFPFLTVGQSHLESRGLKDFIEQPNLVNKPKQALGWGVFVPGYNPPDVETVISNFISAIGGRSGDEWTPTQLRTSQVYDPFRQNQDLKWYANKYAGPVSPRNPAAGDIYASNLASVMNRYAEILDELMKERGESFPTRY